MADILRSVLDARIPPMRVKYYLVGGVALFSLGYCSGNPDTDISKAAASAVDFADNIANGGTTYEKTPSNEIAQNMQNDLAPYQVVDPGEALRIAQERGTSVILGEQISVEDAMRYNYIAGFRGNDLVIKTAIDGKESNYHPGAVGDVNWNLSGDRSVGTSQIYCQPNGDISCEGIRDWRMNFHPQANADHAYQLYEWAKNGPHHDNGLSNDGRFAPWRNNPDGVRDRLDMVNKIYQNLSEMYGSLE